MGHKVKTDPLIADPCFEDLNLHNTYIPPFEDTNLLISRNLSASSNSVRQCNDLEKKYLHDCISIVRNMSKVYNL